jgi:hypothetical protein
MEKKNLKIAYFSFCFGMIFNSVICTISENYYSHKQNNKESKISIDYENTGVIEMFEPGEHIVIEDVTSPLNKKVQYKSHPGYKPVGFSTSTYGSLKEKDAGTSIMFINTETVQANANGKNEEEYYFGEFGIPVDYEKRIEDESNEKEFAPGEHILSISITNPESYDIEYEYHEGYEPIGLATASYGDTCKTFAGASILYTNTKTVECKKQENNEYTEFGTLKEKAKEKVKK